MDDSTVFARWRLCAPPRNSCFLGPTHSPHPKQHLDRFSCFCTAHHRVSLYTLQWAAPPPFKIAYSHGGSRPHLIRCFLGPTDPRTQTASRSFCRAHYCDRPTDRPRYSVCNNRPRLQAIAAMPHRVLIIVRCCFFRKCLSLEFSVSTFARYCDNVFKIKTLVKEKTLKT